MPGLTINEGIEMLKVKRKFGESIVIGNIATVTILGKSHGGFTIGIEAPRDIRCIVVRSKKSLTARQPRSRRNDCSSALMPGWPRMAARMWDKTRHDGTGLDVTRQDLT